MNTFQSRTLVGNNVGPHRAAGRVSIEIRQAGKNLQKFPEPPTQVHQSHFPSSIACHYLILLAVKSSAFSRMHPADLLP